QQASSRPVLTPSELTELQRLQNEEKVWKSTEASLRQQLAAARSGEQTAGRSDLSGSDRADLDRLRKAEQDWERSRTQWQQQAGASADQAAKSQQAEAALRKTNEDLQTRLAAVSGGSNPGDLYMIEAALLEYQTAYQRLDAEAVLRVANMDANTAANLKS